MEHLKDKIRVLVTHQIQFIRSADVILVLNDGKPIALGTYSELINSGLDVVQLLGKDKERDTESIGVGSVGVGGGKSVSIKRDSQHTLSGDELQKSTEAITNRAHRSLSRASSIRLVRYEKIEA